MTAFSTNDSKQDSDNCDHLFTPAVIEHLDRVAAKIDAGEKTLTWEEADKRLEQYKKSWLEKRVNR